MRNNWPNPLILVDEAGKITRTNSFKLYEKYKITTLILVVLLILLLRNVVVLHNNNIVLLEQLNASKSLNASMEKDLNDILVKQVEVEKRVSDTLKEVKK